MTRAGKGFAGHAPPPTGERRQPSSAVRCGAVATVLAASLALALLAPPFAGAAFTRPFVGQLTGAAPGGSFGQVGGVAVDTAGDLWVGAGVGPYALDRFGPAPENVLQASLPIIAPTGPASVAVEGAPPDARVYVTGDSNLEGTRPRVEVFDGATGERLEEWSKFGQPAYVAVDNSQERLEDPSACSIAGCTVYVSHAEEDPEPPRGDGLPIGVEKLDSKGQPSDFVNAKGEPVSFPYVKGDEITGTPTGPGGCREAAFGNSSRTGAVAVDPAGDIFVIDGQCQPEAAAILEYRPSGEFVRAIEGLETPGLGERHINGGFGGNPLGVAYDPVSGHLLVSVAWEDLGAVDEFEGATGRFVAQIVETSAGARLHGPLGAAGSTFALAVDSRGDVYVGDEGTDAVDVYGPGKFLPGLRIAQAREATPTGAVLGGYVNPEGIGLGACRFQYVTEAAFEQNVAAHEGRESEGFADLGSGGEVGCAEPVGSIAPDSTFHAVHAAVGGLVSGTVYRDRLLATTKGVLGGTAVSAAVAFTAPDSPRVDATSASDLSSGFATLHAQIDPLGADTTYRFQYVGVAEYEATGYADASTTPVVDIGSGGSDGNTDASVSEQVGGLSAGTVYHFRVLARNAVGETPGADATFTTLPTTAPGLPDGRAYELVTPANKGSASDMFAANGPDGEIQDNDFGYAADLGNGFLLSTRAAFGPHAASYGNVYVFSREADGWGYTSLAPSSLGVQTIERPIFDPADFARVGFGDSTGSEGSEAGIGTTTFAGAAGGPYATLNVDPPEHILGGGQRQETETVAGSHDLSRILLESPVHSLAPGAETQDRGSTALYEWAGGPLKLVNVDSEGDLLSRCGAVPGQDKSAALIGGAHNAISADGSKVFFTAPDPHVPFNPAAPSTTVGCWDEAANTNTPQLYMRAGGQTIQVSAPEAGFTEAGKAPVRHPVAYVGASEDGSKAFFVTEGELTSNDAGIHDMELYEYDTQEGRLTRISAGESGVSAAGVVTVPAISADGGAVYFTAFGKLTADAPAAGGEETSLYRYDTLTGRTSYVATVLKGEAPSDKFARWFPGPEVAPTPTASWYTTPDGNYLVFSTTKELKPGYSTAGPCKSLPGTAGFGNGHCQELYRYHYEPDSQAGGSLVCVSCNPSGAPPVSNASFARSAFESDSAGQLRAMSDNGEYVFFDTADALVPQDGNGVLDVYEWHEGQLALISSGADSAPSFFLGYSPFLTPQGRQIEGGNVFIGTHARLVPQDTDSSGDVYDARICLPEDPCIQPPGGETAACEGDACQGAPSIPPAGSPGSITFSGAGNPVPSTAPAPTKQAVKKAVAKCKKQKVEKQGKRKTVCVKSKAKKRAKKSGHRRAG